MSVHAKRFALLFFAFGIVAISLVACSTPSSANQGSNNTILIPTVSSAEQSPTPQFPPYTVGAWPSTYSPNLNDNITIYIVCRVQDQSMKGPSHPPPAGVTVNVNVESPINQQFSARTGSDGYAVVSFSFNDPNPGQPVIVKVVSVYQGYTAKNQTFFTPGPTVPPTPTPGGPPGNGTPTVGP